jgi:NADPH:quinone reductase-like Zn-dependent oxidoreductase
VRRFGAYASCVDVPRHQVFALPRALDREVSMHEAAGLPVVYETAWYALHPLASIRTGQTLLVHSGAGGVGGAILQLAKQAGCTTVAVVGRSDKIAVARTLGATHVIDKSREDLWTRAKELAPRGYDVVLDANGAETLSRSYDALRSPGRLIVYGFHTMLPRAGESTTGRPSWRRLATSWLRTPRFDPLKLTGQNKSVMGFNLSYLFEERTILEEAMTAIWRGLGDGSLTPLPTRTFPFDHVADAHRAIESGTTTGKLVLTVTT